MFKHTKLYIVFLINFVKTVKFRKLGLIKNYLQKNDE